MLELKDFAKIQFKKIQEELENDNDFEGAYCKLFDLVETLLEDN